MQWLQAWQAGLIAILIILVIWLGNVCCLAWNNSHKEQMRDAYYESVSRQLNSLHNAQIREQVNHLKQLQAEQTSAPAQEQSSTVNSCF